MAAATYARGLVFLSTSESIEYIVRKVSGHNHVRRVLPDPMFQGQHLLTHPVCIHAEVEHLELPAAKPAAFHQASLHNRAKIPGLRNLKGATNESPRTAIRNVAGGLSMLYVT